jgi:PASTA domain
MRTTSGRVATAAMLLVGLAVLAVAGRLLPYPPSAQRPAGTATTSAPAIRTAPGNTRGYGVPDVLGRTLAQAERMMRTGGLHGSAHERDPQGDNAVVVAQEPPAGALVPPGGVVGFRTRTGVQPYGAPRRLRLGAGPITAAFRIVAPDPATHQLAVAVVVPRATDVEVWLQSGPGWRARVLVLGSTRDATWCRPSHGKHRCVVRLGVPAPGVWTASVDKRSSLPAAIEVTVTFTPL